MKNAMNAVKRTGQGVVLFAGAVAGNAMAAVDTTAAETAISTSITSAEGFGVIIIGGVAALVVVGLLISMTKKLSA